MDRPRGRCWGAGTTTCPGHPPLQRPGSGAGCRIPATRIAGAHRRPSERSAEISSSTNIGIRTALADIASQLSPGIPPHRDAVWRLAREQGVNIDRHRRRYIVWPAVAEGPWANVFGVAAGPNVSVVFAGPVRNDQQQSGTWLYPQFDALAPTSVFGRSLDWTVALDALGKSEASPQKPRAVQERRSLLLDRVMSKAKKLPVMDVLVGGDPLSAEFLSWLVALRAVGNDLGKLGPRLRIRGATSFTTWNDLLCDVLIASSDRRQIGRGEDDRVAKSLWHPRLHFWWHRGSP